MKILSKITMAIFLLGIVACEVERYPYDSIVADKLDESGAGIEAATLGNYAMLKSWTDNWYRLVEYPGDNVALSGTTSDALFFNYNYQHIPNNYRVATYWQNSYQVIVGTNKIFDTFEEGVSEENDQLLGENYYLRAMTYFYLTNIFGRPYTQNPASLAVPLKLDADAKVFPERATVEAVYQQIEADLLKAETLMSSFKENVYASPEAAQALLSRVYLYMEDNQQALAYADKVLASTNVSLLPTETLASYPTIVPESNDETIFAIKFVKDADNLEWSSIGSMFANIQGVGWGEMYASQPYLDLVRQYPSDQRNGFIDPVYLLNDAGEKTLWALYVDNKYQYEWLPVEGAPGQYTYTDANGNTQKLGITMAAGDTTYTIKLADNTRQEVELEYRMADRNGYPKYYITKCSGQEGQAQLWSPVISRLAEMYLNRAEANAKLGNDADALADVNMIRTRAGIPDAGLYTTDNLGDMSVLDVVLQERRLELAFEGHRKFDVYRNKQDMNRRYPGTHLVGTNPYFEISWQDDRVVEYIPQNQLLIQNNLTQNP